jgi:hypothetical protein
MAHADHEGLRSRERIEEYVRWRGQENLTVSSAGLDEDLNDGDIFISEYSQVLLDVFKMGKVGIIANFTGRRSFMKDYQGIGFLYVNKKHDLINSLNEIIHDYEKYRFIQEQAVLKYNIMLKKWRGATNDR